EAEQVLHQRQYYGVAGEMEEEVVLAQQAPDALVGAALVHVIRAVGDLLFGDSHHPFAQLSDPRWRESTLDEAEAVRGEIGLGLRTVFGRQAKRKRFGQIPRRHGNANVARSGGVAEWFRQGPAKPCTPVRFRSPPPSIQRFRGSRCIGTYRSLARV